MSTLLLERSRSGARPGAGGRARPFCSTDSRGGPTLNELIVSVWEGLCADEAVRCPACGGVMAPRHAAGPRAVGGACAGCGSTLS
jgi:hypothetical protein